MRLEAIPVRLAAIPVRLKSIASRLPADVNSEQSHRQARSMGIGLRVAQTSQIDCRNMLHIMSHKKFDMKQLNMFECIDSCR